MRSSFFLFILLITAALNARAQKFQPGSFTDVKGITQTGFIRMDPPGKGPVKEEAFIEFKPEEKMNPIKLSAGEIRSFMVEQDSFVVAHAPGNSTWAGKEFDFVRVVINEEIKLYQGKGTTGGGGRGIGVSPTLGGGFGGGGLGGYGGVGGGVAINLGGRNGGRAAKTAYYFGANTAEMMEVSPVNFNDIMLDIMGDEPQVADQIRLNKFNLTNIEVLIEYFKKVKAANAQ